MPLLGSVVPRKNTKPAARVAPSGEGDRNISMRTRVLRHSLYCLVCRFDLISSRKHLIEVGFKDDHWLVFAATRRSGPHDRPLVFLPDFSLALQPRIRLSATIVRYRESSGLPMAL